MNCWRIAAAFSVCVGFSAFLQADDDCCRQTQPVCCMDGTSELVEKTPDFKVFVEDELFTPGEGVYLVGPNAEVLEADAFGIVKVPGHLDGKTVSIRRAKDKSEARTVVLQRDESAMQKIVLFVPKPKVIGYKVDHESIQDELRKNLEDVETNLVQPAGLPVSSAAPAPSQQQQQGTQQQQQGTQQQQQRNPERRIPILRRRYPRR